MSEHAGIDMISFTGSTRAGIDVAKRAAPTVKRVSQELGGKSPNVILDDADLQKAVTGGTAHVFNNSGQSCNAPTRMIVPAAKMKEAAAIAKAVAEKTKAILIPFILQNVGGNPVLNLPDHIHPTAEGQKIVAENVWKFLKPVLQKLSS